MSGTIGITCTVQSAVKKKELYFKAIDVLETTYNSVKLSYLTNLDKPINSVNVRNIEKMEPRAPERDFGEVGDLRYTASYTGMIPSIYLESNAVKIKNLDDGCSLSISGTSTKNNIVIESSCNGTISMNINLTASLNESAFIIKSGAKVKLNITGSIDVNSSSSDTPTLLVEEGAFVEICPGSSSFIVRGESNSARIIFDSYSRIKEEKAVPPGFEGNNGCKNIKNLGTIIVPDLYEIKEHYDFPEAPRTLILNNGTFVCKNNQVYSKYITGNPIVSYIKETTLILSGQEGVDWVQEENRYLIKNTCNEIILSGSTNKNIETENNDPTSYDDKKIHIYLDNLTSTSKLYLSNPSHIHLKENSKNIINEIELNGDTSDDWLYISSDDKISTLEVNEILLEYTNGGMSISGGIIKINNNVRCEDDFSQSIIISNGVVYIKDAIGNRYLNITSDSAVVITPTVSTFNELKTKKKGFLIKADQFKSIDDLKIFSINNKTGEIIINNDLTIESDYMGSNDLSCPNGQIIINEGTKVIANNLYLQDQQGQTKAPNVDSAGSKLINNGELTILPGKTLYAKALYNATHENNGTIYNLGEIIGKESLVGTGRIVELELAAEVNGELYNDITVDKVNRTVTINNLTPETDYDINLIVSLEPYIERSRAIKVKPMHPRLLAGNNFNAKLLSVPGIENIKYVKFDSQEDLIITSGNTLDFSEKQDESIWAETSGDSLTFKSKSSRGKICFNNDSHNMFENTTGKLSNITSIGNITGGIEPLASNVTDIREAFYGLNNLQYCNLSFGDNIIDASSTYRETNISEDNTFICTSKCIDLSRRYLSCHSLTAIKNIPFWDTSNVVDMNRMFDDCNNLTSINLSRFNTESCKKMTRMFAGCKSLTSIEGIDSWNTAKLTEADAMFNGCGELTNLNLENWDTSKITDTHSMFNGCSKLNGSITIRSTEVTNYSDMFLNCSTDPGAMFIVKYIDDETKKIAEQMVATKSDNSNVYLDGTQPAILVSGREFGELIKKVPYDQSDFSEIKFLKQTPDPNGITVDKDGYVKATSRNGIIYIESEREIFANEDCTAMFNFLKERYYSYISTITFDNFNTSKTKMMGGMFSESHLVTIDLSSFDVSNVSEINTMFGNCPNLEQVTLFESNDSKFNELTCLFMNCSKLKTIDISKINTKNITNLDSVFHGCSSLTEIKGIENIDISNVTYMRGMFYKCSSLTNLNLSNWNTSNVVTNMDSTFGECSKLSGSITIMNPNISSTYGTFELCSTDPSAKFVVNYASGCKEMAQKLVNTKSSNSNVSLGKEYSVLVDGNTFKEKMKTFSNKTIIFENTTNIPEPNGTSIIDLSNTQDKTIVAYTHTYSNETHISSKNIILANEDCSNMFNGSTATKIIFTNFDTRNIKKYNNMFKDCTRLDTDLEITNKNIESYTGMFENASTSSSYKISLSGKKELKSTIDNMIKTKSPSSNIVFSQINILLDGLEFNKKIKSLSWSNYEPYSIRFDEDLKSLNTGTLVDVSKEQDGSIIAVLYKDSWGMSSFKIQSKGKIRASKDASYMFAITTENSSSEAPWLSISTISFTEEMFTETELFVGTFLNWNKLKTINNLNLSKSKVKSMSKMFSGCNELNEFDGYKEYNTLFLSDCSYMFENCNNLPFMQLIRWNTESLVDMTGMFKNANKVNGGIWIKNKNIKTANIADGSHSTLNFYINYTQETKTIANTIVNNSAYGIKIGEDISLLDREKFLDAYKAARYPSEQNSYPIPVNQDEFHRGKAPSGGIDISEAQDGSIIADINDFGLQVYSEKSIMVLDGDSLFPDPRQYSIDPESPIQGSINLSKNFNLTCCENISGMFSHNTSVRSINLTNINTSNVVKASGLFDYCEQSDLEIIGLNNLDFSNLEDAYEMFLMFGTRLDYVQFKGKLSNLKDARKMFSFFHYNELNINLSGNTSDGSYNFEEMFYGGSGRVRLICSDENSIILAKKIQELNSDREILISGGSSN